MKTIFHILLTTLVISLPCSAIHAQSTSVVHSQRIFNSGSHAINPTFRYANKSTAKTTGIASRLIAEVTGNFNSSHRWLPDSTVYSYSGGHGGDYENLTTPYPLKYDLALSWTTDPGTFAYMPSRRRTQTFNPINDQLAVQTEQQWSGSAWVNSARTIVSYNAASQIDTVVSQHYNTGTATWVNYDRIITNYNAGGYNTSTAYDTWSTSTNAYTTQVAYQYTLDANNNRTLELELNYDIATMSLKPGFRVFHHYNTANIEISYAFQQAAGTAWIYTDSTSYILNGANMPIEYLYYTWNAGTSTWTKTSHLLQGYSATGKILYETQQDWNNTSGTYSNYDSTSRTYNVFDQVQRYHFYSFTTGINDAESHYYYEQYTPSGIEKQLTGMQDVVIYPNPVDNILRVSLNLSSGEAVN